MGEAAVPGRSGPLRWWRAFRDWRRSRPFWAGVWTLLAGVELLSIPLAPLSLLIHEGVAGVSGVLMGAFLILLGISLWVAPGYRIFAGVAALVFAVASLVLSNLGGFLVGFLLGVLGGSMAVSWVPDGRPGKPRRPPRGGPPGGRWPLWGGGSQVDTGDGAGPVPAEPRPPASAGGGERRGSAGSADGAARPAIPAATAYGRMSRANRLRVLGILPAGALLATGLQTPAPAAPPPPRVPTDAPETPVVGQRRDDEPLSVCSLLDGLLTAVGATTRGSGSGPAGAERPRPGERGKTSEQRARPEEQGEAPERQGRPAEQGKAPERQARNLPPRARVPDPRGLRPPVRDTPAPSHTPADDVGEEPRVEPEAEPAGGLLGALAGLLGLGRHRAPVTQGDEREHEAPRPEDTAAPAEEGRPPADSHGERPSRPETRHDKDQDKAKERDKAEDRAESGHGEPPAPSLLTVETPRLPSDGGMRGLGSLLPLRIRVGSGDRRSPWCLPEVSLRLSGAVPSGVPAAGRPAVIRTPLLVLTGLTYRGIIELTTAQGPERVLAFTVHRVDIAALRQDSPLLGPACGVPGDEGHPRFVGLPGLALPLLDMGIPGIGVVDPHSSDPWSDCQGVLETDGDPAGTVTATGAPVVLLTKVLSGRLLGLLPVTFSPRMPPPLPPGLTLPIPLFFTDVLAHNQLLEADRLQLPGLRQAASA
ncbi:DUF6114 domain-containing protein [Streptomyces palmae]|uniref:DUF6114 domain-containing protein n=1 Tax=Streptomyces palmae TaxID=1701085 RepID=UPI001AE01E59|nr:DUF6114 domain-containing protein [Streptomyces palmae]